MTGETINGYNYHKYWKTVDGLAECVLDEYDEDTDMDDRIHEAVDGSSLVIYYAEAHAVLWFSNLRDAIDEVAERGARPGTLRYEADSLPLLLCQAAYFALHDDVTERVFWLQREREGAEDDE